MDSRDELPIFCEDANSVLILLHVDATVPVPMKPLRLVPNFAVAVALFGVATAPAQVSAGPCSVTPCHVSGTFDPDLADLKPSKPLDDAVKAAQDLIKNGGNNEQDRSCYPLPITVTEFTKPDPEDPNFQESLNDARMEAIWKYLESKGIDPQINVNPVKAAANSLAAIGGPGSDGSVDVIFNNVDRDPPILKVNSTPAKGTKVKAGDKIKVSVRASERHADGHQSWPSGVKSIQFIANGIVQDSKDYGMKPPPCEVRTFEPTYTVPSDPPSVVQLRVYTEDATGHSTFEDADFPTGDWHGTLREHAQGSIYNDTVVVLFSFKEEHDGTIKGGGRIKLMSEPQNWNNCVSTRTLVSDESELPISGKRVGDEFQLELPTNVTLKIHIKTDCPPPQRSGTTEGRRSLGQSDAFYHPRVKARDGATNSFHKAGAMDVSGSIEIHQAKQ